MDITGELCALLERKKALFLEYEQATLALLNCGAEDAEKYITLRGVKATEADSLIEETAKLCGKAPNAAVLLKTAEGKINFERVPAEYRPVFYAAQAVSSVIHRIMQSEEQAAEHLARLRDEAKDAIRQHQHLPKIRKYLTGLGSEAPPSIGLRHRKA